ncbi:MAG: hypothetical protein HOY76_23410 [Streptomyces sp.]|nr:hypothetical protein [Streptomyces sp.]
MFDNIDLSADEFEDDAFFSPLGQDPDMPGGGSAGGVPCSNPHQKCTSCR